MPPRYNAFPSTDAAHPDNTRKSQSPASKRKMQRPEPLWDAGPETSALGWIGEQARGSAWRVARDLHSAGSRDDCTSAASRGVQRSRGGGGGGPEAFIIRDGY
ncbi:hypothetical protein NDU88_007643 [Pleurodeles waltl]|uniref:Uncharacterized protein n=1 Tax=Pleurodeles waltl TaxID=8319 RepID=A0AAV7U3P8_PLEWA|nr:hypothetical protein NDU88_007643 [Pleurodeles waltl]